MDERILKEKKVWDKTAHRYDRQTARYIDNAYRRTIEKAKEVISKDDVVLDIGCGTGIITLGIAQCAERVIAYDISENMIQIAREKAKRQLIEGIEFHVGDGYALSHEDSSFDVVLLCNVLHFLKEPSTQLKEAHRLLRDGGILITTTDCYGEPARFPVSLWLGLQTIMHRVGVIPYMTNFRKGELVSLIETSRFEIIEEDEFYENPVNYYIEAKKV
jgi:ubiquinone/menaquinone biosynthesis C-methylase UbiE